LAKRLLRQRQIIERVPSWKIAPRRLKRTKQGKTPVKKTPKAVHRVLKFIAHGLAARENERSCYLIFIRSTH
jgi:hypothetical protein